MKVVHQIPRTKFFSAAQSLSPLPPSTLTIRVLSRFTIASTTFTTIGNAYLLHQAIKQKEEKEQQETQALEKSFDQFRAVHSSQNLSATALANDPFLPASRRRRKHLRDKDRTEYNEYDHSLQAPYTEPNAETNNKQHSHHSHGRTAKEWSQMRKLFRQRANSLSESRVNRIMASTLEPIKSSTHAVYGRPPKANSIMASTLEPIKSSTHAVYGRPPKANKIIASTLEPIKNPTHAVYVRPPNTFHKHNGSLDFFSMPENIREVTRISLTKKERKKKRHDLAEPVYQWLKGFHGNKVAA
ncbi:MAG: hypothetical protein Q9227_003078 [Pyrenula ochraceoflavens]